jgi:hypothetical protein
VALNTISITTLYNSYEERYCYLTFNASINQLKPAINIRCTQCSVFSKELQFNVSCASLFPKFTMYTIILAHVSHEEHKFPSMYPVVIKYVDIIKADVLESLLKQTIMCSHFSDFIRLSKLKKLLRASNIYCWL